MSTAAWMTSITLLAATLMFTLNRWPMEIVALGSAFALVVVGVISPDQMISGFSSPTVILIASLLIVAEALDATGVTAWVSGIIDSSAGNSRSRALVLTMTVAALMGTVITATGATAALVPSAVKVCQRMGMTPSRMLMPLAFAAKVGPLLILVGSPINIMIAHAIGNTTGMTVGFFTFGILGAPLLLATVVITSVLVWLLPPRRSVSQSADLSSHGETLAQHYGLDHVFHLRPTKSSPLVGARISDQAIRADRIKLIPSARGGPTLAARFDRTITEGELLTVIGDRSSIESYAQKNALEIVDQHSGSEPLKNFLNVQGGIVEVMIPPRSRYVHQEVNAGQRLLETDVVVLAAHRLDHEIHLPAKLNVGDTLLVEGSWDSLEATSANPDVLLVDAPSEVRRQTVKLGRGSGRAIAIAVTMVALMATALLTPAVAGILAAIMVILTGVIAPEDAYRRVQWGTVFLIAGILPMSTAVEQSGLADVIAGTIVDAVGRLGPAAILAVIFVVGMLLTQVLTGIPATLIMIPITLSVAKTVGVSPVPLLMGVLIGCSAAFLTPVAAPANAIIMGPGGYRFMDYLKLGLPVTIVFSSQPSFTHRCFGPSDA